MDDGTAECEQDSKTGAGNKDKEDDASTNSIATANESTPKMFKLNVDCFEHLFEWLSLKELLVFRCTCKRMKLVVDYYIKLNYPKLRYKKISSYLGRLDHEVQPKYLEWCKYLCLFGMAWKNIDSESIECVLNQLETLKLQFVSIDGDLYDIFLKYCIQLKYLAIRNYFDTYYKSSVLIGTGYEWLHRTYPTLTHFEIDIAVDQDSTPYQYTELLKFFELNNIRVYSVNSTFLLLHHSLLLESNIKLDRLDIEVDQDVNVTYNLVSKLYNRQFYKQLHLHCPYGDEYFRGQAHHLSEFHNLEKLYFISRVKFTLTKLTLNVIKELDIERLKTFQSDQDLAQITSNLINLQYIKLYFADLEEIMSLLCYVPKLKRIDVRFLLIDRIQTCDLIALNEGRQKLVGACKVTIFIPEDRFLKLKWKGKVNFDFIEFKRLESREVNCVFYSRVSRP